MHASLINSVSFAGSEIMKSNTILESISKLLKVMTVFIPGLFVFMC